MWMWRWKGNVRQYVQHVLHIFLKWNVFSYLYIYFFLQSLSIKTSKCMLLLCVSSVLPRSFRERGMWWGAKSEWRDRSRNVSSQVAVNTEERQIQELWYSVVLSLCHRDGTRCYRILISSTSKQTGLARVVIYFCFLTRLLKTNEFARGLNNLAWT